MNTSAYLASEYLICLLLAFAAAITLFACAAIILAADALWQSVTRVWEATIGPGFQEIGRHLRNTTGGVAICVARVASVTAHSAPLSAVAERKRG